MKSKTYIKTLAKNDGLKIEQVIVNDDVDSTPKDKMEDRRGAVGEVILWKVAGAKSKEGASLEELKKTAEKTIFNTRSMGVAHTPCTVPTAGECFTSLEMEGFSITLTSVDGELKRLIDAPARAPLFVQM